jgi:hypothetical protein
MVIQRLSFPITRMRKPPCQGRLYLSPPVFFSRVDISASPRTQDCWWDKSTSGFACATWLQGTKIYRVSHVRLPSGQSRRYCSMSFLSERRTMYTDTMHSTILSRQKNKAAQICCTDFGFVRAFPFKERK